MADYSKDFSISYATDPASCTLRFRCFDTPNSVTLYGLGEERFDAEAVLLSVRQMCLDLHMIWSFSLPGSDVHRLNQPRTRVEVDARTASLIEKMKAFSAAEPSFDFTIGPVSYLWKHARVVPSGEEIGRALSHVGAGNVEIDGRFVVKHDPEAQVDVGGGAKGFAADAIVAKLRESGVACADIDLGGNLYLVGAHPHGRPWRVAVRVPEGVEAKPPVIELADASVVTSGSYERFVEIDGKRYQHIVDARTGWPCESDVVSATVVAKSSLEADLLATTACLLGSGELPALAARHDDCRFIVITDQGDVLIRGIIPS